MMSAAAFIVHDDYPLAAQQLLYGVKAAPLEIVQPMSLWRHGAHGYIRS
jgi:hypothetical protein